jgi:RHS repeat-associated protein
MLVDTNGSGSTYFVHDNQVGSTIRLTNSTGASSAFYSYDAWGQPFHANEKVGVAYNYRFNGKELDPDFVLFNSNNRRYHYPARTYVPFRARFVQFDPLLFRSMQFEIMGAILNKLTLPYALVAPTLSVDPLGLLTVERCNQLAGDVRTALTAIRLKMAKRPCDLPKIDCQSCRCLHPHIMGYADPETGDIVICVDHITVAGIGDVHTKQIIKHEYIHSFDRCFGADFVDCEDRACSEIRAYSGSGNCDAGGSNRRPGVSRRACVNGGAAASMAESGCDAAAAIAAVEEKCLLPDGTVLPPGWPR